MSNKKGALLTEEQRLEKVLTKKKRRKIALRIFIGFLVVLALFVGITTMISVIGVQSNINKAHNYGSAGCAQLEYSVEDNGYVNIKSDKGLKVMQLTDVHIGGGWMSIKKDAMAINTVATMIRVEKPDFVVVTGDISYPVPFQAGTFNNKSGAKIFAELMETLGVYWTLAYGNHDTEAYSYYTREQLTDFYRSEQYKHCLLQPGPEDVDGVGNQVINIVNSDGVITRSLITLDSHSYIDGDVLGIRWLYDNIHENQINWYKNVVLDLAKRNQDAAKVLPAAKQKSYAELEKVVPTSVFFHFPMEEYRLAWTEYVENNYKDTKNVKYRYGLRGESGKVVYCGIHPDQLFETMQALGSTDSTFCGHDHYNNFSLNYKGINLTYGYSIDYLAYVGIYKQGTQRGCTILDYDQNGGLDFHQENYYQDKYQNDARESVTMQEITTSGLPVLDAR